MGNELIQEEANRKRAEAAKERERTEKGTFQKKGEPVATQPVFQVARRENTNKSYQAKAIASKTNRGTVERMDRLYRKRPTLVLLILLSLWGMWWGTGFVVEKIRGCDLT